jgi:hypothetical protein
MLLWPMPGVLRELSLDVRYPSDAHELSHLDQVPVGLIGGAILSRKKASDTTSHG